MGFEYKKQQWMPYGRKARILEINIKDKENQTIDNVKLEKGKDAENHRMLKRIKKHGFNLSLEDEKDMAESVEEERKKEVDWLGKGDW